MFYLLTVFGRWLNVLTLATLLWILAFTAPKVYRDNQKAIDEAAAPVWAKYREFADKLAAALPKQVTGGAEKKTE